MKITPTENYLRLGRGEDPAYIPRFTMMGDEYLGEACCKMLGPQVFPMGQFIDGGYDMWGVRYKADPYTGATLPEPGNFLLEDIADWRGPRDSTMKRCTSTTSRPRASTVRCPPPWPAPA